MFLAFLKTRGRLQVTKQKLEHMDYESQAHHLPRGNSGGKETGEQKNWDVGGFLEKKKILLLLLLFI